MDIKQVNHRDYLKYISFGLILFTLIFTSIYINTHSNVDLEQNYDQVTDQDACHLAKWRSNATYYYNESMDACVVPNQALTPNNTAGVNTS